MNEQTPYSAATIKLSRQIVDSSSRKSTRRQQSSHQLSKINKYLEEITEKDNDVKTSIESIKKKLNITLNAYSSVDIDIPLQPTKTPHDMTACLNCSILKRRVQSVKYMTSKFKDELRILVLQNNRLLRQNNNLEFKITQLEDQLKHRNKRIDQEIEKQNQLVVECRVKTLENEGLMRENCLLKGNVERLQLQLAQLLQNVQSLNLQKQQLVAHHSTQLSTLTIIIANNSHQMNEIQKQNQHKLSAKQVEMQTIIQQHRVVVEEMRRELEEKQGVIELINKSLSSRGDELVAVRERLKEKEKECVGLKQEVGRLKETNNYLTQLMANYQIQPSLQQQHHGQLQVNQQPQQQSPQPLAISSCSMAQIQQQLQSLRQQLHQSQQQQDLYIQKFQQNQSTYLNRIHQLQDKLQQLQSFYQTQLNINQGLKMNLKQHELQKATLSSEKSVLFYQTVNLNSQVDKLTAKVQNIVHEKQLVQKEVMKLNSQIKSLHNSFHQKQQQSIQLMGRLSLMQSSANRIQHQYTEHLTLLQQQIVKKQQKIIELQQQLASSLFMLRQQQQRVTELQLKYEQQQRNNIHQSCKQCISLNSKLQASHAEISQLSTQIDNITKLLGQQKSQRQIGLKAYESVYKQMLVARDEVERRGFELQRVNQRLEGAESHILLAENEIVRLSEKVGSLEGMLGDERQMISRLQKENQQLRLQHSNSYSQLSQLQSTISTYHNQLSVLRQQLQLQRREKQTIRTHQEQCQTIQSNEINYQYQFRRKQNQFQKMSQCILQKQSQIDSLIIKCLNLNSERQQLQIQLTYTRGQQSQKQQTLIQMQNSIQSFIHQLSHKQSQIEQLNSFLTAKQLEYDSYRFKYQLNYKQLQEDMNDLTHTSKQNITNLQSQLQSSLAEKLSLTQQLQKLQHSLQQTRQKSLRYQHYSQQKEQELQQLLQQLQERGKIIQMLKTIQEEQMNSTRINSEMVLKQQIQQLMERCRLIEAENNTLKENNISLSQHNTAYIIRNQQLNQKQVRLQKLQLSLTQRLIELQQLEVLLVEKQDRLGANEVTLEESLVNVKNMLKTIERKAGIVQRIRQKKAKKVVINKSEQQQQQNAFKLQQQSHVHNEHQPLICLQQDLAQLQQKIFVFQQGIKQPYPLLPHNKKQRSVIDILDEFNLKEQQMKQQSLNQYIPQQEINVVATTIQVQLNQRRLGYFDQIEMFWMERVEIEGGSLDQGVREIMVMVVDVIREAKAVLIAISQQEIHTILQTTKQTINKLFTSIRKTSTIPYIPLLQLSPVPKQAVTQQQQVNIQNYSAQFKKKKPQGSIQMIKQGYSEFYSQRSPIIHKQCQDESQQHNRSQYNNSNSDIMNLHNRLMQYQQQLQYQNYQLLQQQQLHQQQSHQQQNFPLNQYQQPIQSSRRRKQRSIVLIEDINQAVSLEEIQQTPHVISKNSSFKQFSLNQSAGSVKFKHMRSLISDVNINNNNNNNNNNSNNNNKQLQNSSDSKPPSMKNSLQSNRFEFENLSEIPTLMRSQQSSLSKKQQQDRYKANMKSLKVSQKLKSKRKR